MMATRAAIFPATSATLLLLEGLDGWEKGWKGESLQKNNLRVAVM